LQQLDGALAEFETYLELEIMYNTITDIIEMLSDISRDGKFGRCNEKGLNQEFLIDHLREIESNKMGIAPIFASWEWQKYYDSNLCSIASHENEIWITMRIPIVNLADQFVRAIPLSSQLWIRDSFYDLGLTTTLFRIKNLDTFMVLTNSNFESCSKVGQYRVCNVRKTKFRMAQLLVVPIVVDHNRIVTLTNATDSVDNSSNLVHAKSLCNGDVSSLIIKARTVVRIPEQCAVIGKTFELSRDHVELQLNSEVEIESVKEPSLRYLDQVKHSNPNISIVTPLPKSSNEIERNNLETQQILNTINFSTMEKGLIASSSTMSVVAFIALMIIIWIKCCNTNESREAKIDIALTDRSRSNSMKNECNGMNVDLANSQESSNETDDSLKNLDNKKPPFQLKR